MTETLEWYAKRGLLAASDEDVATNQERLRAGRKLAHLYASGATSGGLVSRYEAKISRSGATAGTLTGMETQAAKTQQLAQVLQSLPPRTRPFVEMVCLKDQRVGKAYMERLRCGLDAISQKNTKSANMY